MGVITIVSKKKVLPQESLSAVATLIDEFGELAEKLAPVAEEIKDLQAKLAPLGKAQKALQAAIDALDLEDDIEDHVERGAVYEAIVGKRGTSRSIKDLDKVKAYLGVETFMKLATVKLGDIDAYLTPPQKDDVLKIDRSSHSVKVQKRG